MSLIVDTPDGYRCDYEHLRSLQAPESTHTWRSLHHADVVDLVKASCGRYGLEPTGEEFSTGGSDEARFFGIIHFEGLLVKGGHMCLGIRNSWDKSMAFGMTAGQRIFVCTNLAFSGDFLALKKHTAGLTDWVLQGMVADAVNAMQDRLLAFNEWIDGLAQWQVPWKIQENIVRQAVYAGVVPRASAMTLAELWVDKKNDKNEAVYDNSLHGLHGAVTQAWNSGEKSLVGMGDRSLRLTKFIEDVKPQILVHRRYA